MIQLSAIQSGFAANDMAHAARMWRCTPAGARKYSFYKRRTT
jgi:hypothetical protein